MNILNRLETKRNLFLSGVYRNKEGAR